MSPKVEEQKPELRDISTITPYELNSKKHPPEQVRRLAQSIKKFGWRGNPILVDEGGVIVAGHGRRLAALELGMTRVPVVVLTGMTEDELRALRLADNRTAISDFDTDLLEAELTEFEGLSDMLDGIFDKKELDFAVADLMSVDATVFETDLGRVIDEQEAHTDSRIKAADDKPVQAAKALGIVGKKVPGRDAAHLARFMAEIQASTNEADPLDALIAHARTVLETQ